MRRYAAAWGIGIGWVIGGLIGIPLRAFVELSMTGLLVGLIIGSVIAQGAKMTTHPPATSPRPSASERLQELETLKSESRITEDEYQTKRRQIIEDV